MKKSNIMSASALFLGIILAVATSAFKPLQHTDRAEYTYGRLADGTWIPLDDVNYQCLSSQNVCKGTFSYQNPDQNAIPDVRIEQNNGTYTPQ